MAQGWLADPGCTNPPAGQEPIRFKLLLLLLVLLFFFFKRWGLAIFPNGLQLIGSSDPAASASQIAGITGMYYCTQFKLYTLNSENQRP